jgi:hypothetical protein
MALIKKIDVENYFAARRAMRLGRIGLLRRPAVAGTEPAGKATEAQRLIGNRTLGDSSPSVSAIATPIVAVSDVKEDRSLPESGQE